MVFGSGDNTVDGLDAEFQMVAVGDGARALAAVVANPTRAVFALWKAAKGFSTIDSVPVSKVTVRVQPAPTKDTAAFAVLQISGMAAANTVLITSL